MLSFESTRRGKRERENRLCETEGGALIITERE